MRSSVALALSAVLGVVALAAYELGLASSIAFGARAACGACLAISAFARAGGRVNATALGIVLAAIADTLLASSAASAKLFVVAMAIFAAGHASFTGGLWRLAPEGAQRKVVTLLPLTAYAIAILSLLWGTLGPLRVPVVVYVALLTVMCWRAVLAGRRELVAAGLLFVVGDTALAINKFYAPLPHAKLLALAPYWASLGAFVVAIPARSALTSRAGGPM